ncbi:hypothetical protein J19TS2_13070 [Cohnella xylanilytica]|uniref:hypothetical protein n=1 Tax=Cohnella xylanilytica TaxID=557555 RepID=UPI001B1754A9|nr:hypothetical protein [Cohnella xylanilytica]GIO11752.1 hypothetical protein J19TS2_13070 [Cohnella xylanilytica]
MEFILDEAPNSASLNLHDDGQRDALARTIAEGRMSGPGMRDVETRAYAELGRLRGELDALLEELQSFVRRMNVGHSANLAA